MNRRAFLKKVTAVGLSLSALPTRGAQSQSRPNIVLMLADDMGYADLTCYGGRAKTPNLDKLACEGVRFTSCYAGAPNCSPARASLLTGRFPTRAGIYSYIPANPKIVPHHPMHLTAAETTIATLLRDAGYDTCHVGKWHLSKLNSDQPQPKDHGFDHSLGTDNNAEPSHKDPVNFIRNGVEVGKTQGYSCQIVTDEAIQWLRNRKTPDKPFFLYVAFHEPHVSLASPPEMQKQYPDASEKDRLYFANIQNLDNAAGRLLAALDRMNLRTRTFVFFTSDNGPWRQGSQGNMRGKKGGLYEGGIREPGIIRWPGKVKPGTVNSQPVHAADFLPTVCSIAAIQPPKDKVIDGVDLSALLAGKPWKRPKPLYWYFYRTKPQAALRDGDWVLIAYQNCKSMPKTHRLVQQDIDFIKNAHWDRFELYNIIKDSSQQHDLAAKEPQRLNAMKKTLIDLHKEIIRDVPHWTWK